MSHDPKLNVYTITLNKEDNAAYGSNKWLFKHKIGKGTTEQLENNFIMAEAFRLFINALDNPEMFTDTASKKCMTANQANIDDDNVAPNIIPHFEKFIFEGIVEGGAYGKKRNKTSTVNKVEKSTVSERDAITDDFYFLLYCPLNSSKSILMIQSYSDDSIDSVQRKFYSNFFRHPKQFKAPKIERYIPQSIIEDFKSSATVSSFEFSTEVPGELLIQESLAKQHNKFSVTVQIKPADGDLSTNEFDTLADRIQRAIFATLKLGNFQKKRAYLRDQQTKKTTPFELDSTFDIAPTIILRKYITITGSENDFKRIRGYCMELLETLKTEIYTSNAVYER